MTRGKRHCSKCNLEKPLSEFHRNRRYHDGLYLYCKLCKSVDAKLSYQRAKETNKERNRRNALKRLYGLTPEQYEELLARQNGCCAICNRHHSQFSKRLAVEHDHRTGFIRGLCCSYCNRGLAAYHDKAEFFRSAAAYLEQHTGLKVPDRKPKRRKRRRPR